MLGQNVSNKWLRLQQIAAQDVDVAEAEMVEETKDEELQILGTEVGTLVHFGLGHCGLGHFGLGHFGLALQGCHFHSG